MGGMYVLLHNVFYFIGWYGDEYSMTYTLKKLLMTALFKDVENLLASLWVMQSLLKGLVITYIVCLIPKKLLPFLGMDGTKQSLYLDFPFYRIPLVE